MTQDQKLTNVEEKLKRWMTRGRRAQTAIDKLLRQRQRLLKAPAKVTAKPKVVTDSEIPLPELDAFFLPTQPLPLKHHDDLAAMPSNQHDDLTIPPDLRRTTAPGKPGPKRLSDIINKPFIDARKKKRLEKMDEKRRGRSMFDKSDMPLTGRDALKAIRAKKA